MPTSAATGAPAALVATLASIWIAAFSGCAPEKHTLVEAFPKGAHSAPWALQGPVWSGTFEQAAAGLGEDAEKWRELSPQRVWLALYQHDSQRSRRMIVRAFALESPEAARRAFDRLAPLPNKPFKAGDGGCWTQDGVMFHWGRLIVDVFNTDTQRTSIPEQAVYLVAFLEKSMPPGIPESPQ